MQSFFGRIGGGSIRTQLILLSTVLVSVSIFVLTAFTTGNSIHMLELRTARELSQTLQQGVDNLTSFIKLSQSNLDLWAGQPIVDVFFRSPELATLSTPGLATFFSRIRSNEPWFDSILLTDGGEILYDQSKRLIELNDWEGSEELKRFLVDPEAASLVLMLPLASEARQATLILKRPFALQGRSVPGKYLVALFDLDALQKLLFGNVQVGINGFVTLLADSGQPPLWAPKDIDNGTEAESFVRMSDFWQRWEDIPASSESLVIRVQQLSPHPLAVAGVASNRDIMRMVVSLVELPVAAGLLVLLVGVVVTVVLSIKITRPLAELLTDVKQLELDNLEGFQGVLQSSSYTEVSSLHMAFHSMVQKLIVSRRELQQKNDHLREMEQSLRLQRNFLQTILSSFSEGVITTDRNSRITFINPLAEQILGCKREESLDKPLATVFQLFDETTGMRLEDPVSGIINSGGVIGSSGSTILRTGSGREIPIDNSGAPIRDDAGNIHGIVLVFRNIEERRKAEKAVLESEERFRIMFEKNPTSIWLEDFSRVKMMFDELKTAGVGDLAGYLHDHPETLERFATAVRIIDVNEATLTLHEANSKKELLADLRKIFTQESYAVFQEELVDLWQGETLITKEAVVKTLSGKSRHVAISGHVVPGYEQTLGQVLVSINDITERQSLEEQLHQAQKLETIGTLAGGVAHDFNNMLSVILGYCELSLDAIKPEHPIYVGLKEIQNAAKRSSELTRQLLAFARKQTITPKVLDLNATVDGMLKMLRRLVGENLDLAWYPADDLWPVYLDPSQLDQILVNLCVNSRDAIVDVGKITLETAMKTFDDAYCIKHSEFHPGDFVMLAVSDNGCGMDKETKEKIFEPFFTTKTVGQGTGMGLATVYGIVKQNEGFINVYSEPGKGTTFKVYFARYSGEPESVRELSAEGMPLGKNEQILLVEDEVATMKLTERMLQSLRYQVLAASSTEKALQLAEIYGDNIDLLMTDVVMPVMNGRELAEQLRARYPNLNCLFMSGYTANVIAHQGILDKGVNFIQKPYTRSDLAQKVRAALKR